jgi:hypothetical protein
MRIGIVSVLCSLFLLPISPLVVRPVILLFILLAFLAIGVTLLRVLIVALVFARVSMLQILSFSLVVGALGSLATILPDGFNASAVFDLIGLVCYVGYTITLQDPSGENRRLNS